MNEFITDIVSPRQLTAAVQAAATGGLPFEGIIPSRPTDNVHQQLARADFTTSAEVARYRAWDTVPDIGRRPAFTVEDYEIAPLGWSYRLNEEDFTDFGRLRQGLADRFTEEAIRDVFFNDALRASQAVLNRITLTHAELLQFGRVTLDELGNVETGNAVVVTFPVPATQLGVVPAVLWSDHTNAVPVTNLKVWEAIYRANNDGRNPDAWGISSEVAADLALSNQVKEMFSGVANWRGVITDAQVGQVIRAAGVQAPLVVTNDVERPALVGGASGRVINNRRVIGMQAGMANTYFAPPPALVVMPANARLERREGQGVIAYSQTGIRPPSAITTAEAVALPLLERPNALFVATV